MILSATQRLIDHGQFHTPTEAQGRGHPHYSPELEENILEYFELHPRKSTRVAVRHFGVSQFYVWNVLTTENLHPFHYRADPRARMSLCQWLIEHPHENILWTDESTFTRAGMFNIHNEHWWARNNLHLIREYSHQIRFSVNVWAGIINDQLIGPIFIEGNLTGGTYLGLIQNVIPELLEDVPLAYLSNLYYQHDGCPAHYSRAVQEYLNMQFGDRWIGRNGPVAWPPRRPDLTPLDFFLVTNKKACLYRRGSQSRPIKRKIILAFNVVKSDTKQIKT